MHSHKRGSRRCNKTFRKRKVSLGNGNLTKSTLLAMLLCQIVDRGLTETQLIMMVIFDATFEDDTVASEWIKGNRKSEKEAQGTCSEKYFVFNLDKYLYQFG